MAAEPHPQHALVAIVFGVGRSKGLGGAIARRFARGGLHVVVVGRTRQRLDQVVAEIKAHGGGATAMAANVANETEVASVVETARSIGGGVAAVIYNAGGNRWSAFLATELDFFEQVWRDNCLGAFIVGREAARAMAAQGFGSILYTSASAAWRGKPSFAAFTAAKGGARLLAQSMAKELGPMGVHVATVVVDGVVDGDRVKELAPQLLENKPDDGAIDPEAVAEVYWQIHRQPRSAWTHEVDLRPFSEEF